MSRYRMNNGDQVKYWNGEESAELLEKYANSDLQITTYNNPVNFLLNMNSKGHVALEKIQLIILDECHCLIADQYMKDIKSLFLWLREKIIPGEKMVVGLTATPELVIDGMETHNIPVNILLKRPLFAYKARNLICTDCKKIPTLLCSDQIQGKSLVMCRTIKQCQNLCDKLPGSAMLVSRTRKEYSSEMERIRKYIIRNRKLPETTFVANRITGEIEEVPLHFLVATDTIREGFNLEETCEVRNVVCFYVDEMHITQLVGRCRYDIDNLIVADCGRWQGQKKDPYKAKYISMFEDYLNKGTQTWFNCIRHIIGCSFSEIRRDHSVGEVKALRQKRNETDFLKWLDGKGYIYHGPYGLPSQVYGKKAQLDIVSKAKDLQLLDCYKSEYTFNRVMNFLRDNLHCTIMDKDGRKNGKHYRYKLIILPDGTQE